MRLPLATLLGFLSCPAAAQENVLIVLIDDLGRDSSALYPDSIAPAPMPRLDALAARGVTFDTAWANPMCSPSRAALLTGRYGFRTGVRYVIPEGGLGLPNSEITIPEQLQLRGAGYATAAIGKWHLNDVSVGFDAPNQAGFDHFAGMFLGLANYYDWARTVNGTTTRSSTWATTQNVDDALDWIGQQTKPWLCYFSPFSAHSPYQAPPPQLHTQDLTGLDPQTDPLPFYRAMLEATDTEIGRLIDGLGPVASNTHIIVMGDNGTPGDVTAPGSDPTRGKGTPYEGGVLIPMLVAGPAVQDGGRRVSAPVSVTDVFATVADMVGVSSQPDIAASDSVSLMPYLTTPGVSAQRQHMMTELAVPFPTGGVCGYFLIRGERYKLIRNFCSSGGLNEQFFDLLNDPREQVNLLSSSMSAAELARFIELASALDNELDASARFERVGSGTCAGSIGVPQVRTIGKPRLGALYGVSVSNAAPGVAAVFSVGSSIRSFNGIPLPFDLEPLGAGAGCAIYSSLDALDSTITDNGGRATRGIPLSSDPWLLGARVHHQWFMLDPAANQLGLATTETITAVIGF